MAAKTPETLATLRAAPTTATFVHPYSGDLQDAGTLTRGDYAACRHTMHYFGNVDDTDTWASGIQGIKHLAFEATSAGAVNAALTTIATGAITFQTDANDQTGILHVWSQG